MWRSGFFTAGLMALALLGFTGSETALAAYFASSEVSVGQPLAASASEGSFKLAVTVDNKVPEFPPLETPAEKVATPKPAETKENEIEQTSKPINKKVDTAQTIKTETKKTPKVEQTSKPKNKKVKTAQTKKSETKKAPKKEEPGFFTKTFNSLMGDSGKDNKKKTLSSDKGGEKEESGFLTKTLKSLVGSDHDKDSKKAKKNALNPMEMAPTGSATNKKDDHEPKTAMSETKATLKGSFEKMVGVGSTKDKGGSTDPKSGKKEEEGLLTKLLGGDDEKDKPAAGKQVKGTAGKETREAKKDKGGLFDGVLGGGDKKKDQAATKQANAEKKASQPAPAKPGKITPIQTSGTEAEKLKSNRGGTQKGKNVLKESFKNLLNKEKGEEEK